MSNPFEETTAQNPWSNHNDVGPRYGNAYESSSPAPAMAAGSPALPPRKNVANSPYNTQRMPSPSDYTSPAPVVNAWQESNKTLDENERNAWSSSPAPAPAQPANAYQYAGTPYGNTSNVENAYSPAVSHPEPASQKIETQMSINDNASVSPVSTGRPSRIRVLLRIILFIAAVGHLGFAAGASPYSGQPVPFDSSACFYFLFAVAILSIIYSGYHVVLYLVRRFGSANKLKRPILIMCDLFMALMWGIGIIVEIAKYTCPPGHLSGWCNFYNTSIFFGFVSFALYVLVVGWDLYGGMCAGKRK
ncbi:uncharacterized protein B0P05DRAFT_541764 [Gilbertella persicaria]|uniref:uncharacterized protein n=1 Tax=Gilbertella persicaria TaxID=101096 RepID=UPI002220B883|nr:uncharacterized protein B0P05DRAFT_541764 [Gilbertella persicaria]KAI8078939.1 hypothetical protein B0P05DRAFT_541764 [Gilbertella persicaria]